MSAYGEKEYSPEEERKYRFLMEYACRKNGLKQAGLQQNHPGVTVLYDHTDGRWHACGRRISGEQIGRNPSHLYYAIEIPFDPQMIPVLENMTYCARAQFMDSREWLMLVIDEKIENSTYTSLIDLSGSWSAKKAERTVREEPVYRDMRIPVMEQRSSGENVPEKIAMMRKMDRNGFTPEQKAVNFYDQAMFMKDYTDDYAFRGTFRSSAPVYHQMTVQQLRGYFAWRTWVKENSTLPPQTLPSFFLVYVYEVLNLIHGDPAESFDILMRLRVQNAALSLVPDMYLSRWASDLAVYYDLPGEYLSQCFILEDISHFQVLAAADRNPDACRYTDEEIGSALMTVSRASFAGSSFLKQNQEEMKRYLTIAYRFLCRAYRKDSLSFYANHICQAKSMLYTMFPQAVFHEKEQHPDSVVFISMSNIFQYSRGYWKKIELIPRTSWQSVVREAERIARRELKSKRPLKQVMESGRIINALEEAMQEYLKEKKEASRQKITINMDLLSSIRSDAAETRDSLLVSDEEYDLSDVIFPEGETAAEETELPVPLIDEPVSAEDPDLPGFFTAEEAVFLRSLMEGKHPAVSGSVQVLCDRINEKMIDEIGDTVIEYNGDIPELIEDYLEDLGRLLGGGV